LILTRLCSVVALAVIIFASFLRAQLERLRTGHWDIEHFLAYFRAHVDCLPRLASTVCGRRKAHGRCGYLGGPARFDIRITLRASARCQRSWRSVSGGATLPRS
jgi:hypothetical protein